jgi:tetratricopeptide (TPR) repeat protein
VPGLVIDDSSFEVVAGTERIGSRRRLNAADVTLLKFLASRYMRAVYAGSSGTVFLGIGQELYRWIDGEQGQLTALLNTAETPLVFEVQGPRLPSEQAWAVLRAPFELLARPGGEFLAQDPLFRFCVARRLGPPTPPPPHDQYRLGLAFMASSPRGQHELDYEAEESAILKAVGEHRIDLIVDDTGDPEQLAHRLANLGGVPAVHVSCHGLNNWRLKPDAPGVPVLMMEDDAGGCRPTTAADLARLLPAAILPRLLFVSACLTATGADATGHLPSANDDKLAGKGGSADAVGDGLVAHSLATALVTAGLPAVIGWDGSVGDRAATLFAEHLYPALAGRADLAVAVGDARRVLLHSEDQHIQEDWHLARLWLGPAGGGPLVAGKVKRSLISAAHGTKTFLAGKPKVPVAASEMFVGRRKELQRALRALRSDDWSGVLLRGQGRLGKSSLAARIADRCGQDYAIAVVFGDYSALGILDAVAAAVRTNQVAVKLIEDRLPEVRQRPEAIEQVLIELLSGPCAQQGDGKRPLLLIIDDLEQVLVAHPSRPHQVASRTAPVLGAVLSAFDPAETDSRLLLTSRFAFTLNGLEARLDDIQLPPLSDVAQLKLLTRQRALTTQSRQDERVGLAARAVAVSRGNPGLQDLIALRLVYGENVPLDRAEAAVSSMEAFLDQGDLPADADVRSFLENLALDALLAEAGETNRELLRAATLLRLPVPEAVMTALSTEVGGSPARLRGLGLLDPYPDPADPRRVAVAASLLAAGRLPPLTDAERVILARIAAPVLFTAWGGAAAESGWDPALGLQLTMLALLADDPVVAAACARSAVAALFDGPAGDAFQLGQDAVALLDRNEHPVPIGLLQASADAAFTVGNGEEGEALLNRAASLAEAGNGQDVSPLERAEVIRDRARRLITRGELDHAETLLRRACQLFAAEGAELQAAVAMGYLADIAYTRGDLDEAMRIGRDVQLPIYERLGDVWSATVTWGQLGNIAEARGDLDEALRILSEQVLPVTKRLGDVRETAVASGKIADIAFARGDLDGALRILSEQVLPVVERLGDARMAAVAWGKIGNIAFVKGYLDEALRIHSEQVLPVVERLGDARMVAVAWGKIADIAQVRGDLDEALRIRREVELPTFERAGDLRETAVAWSKIADVAFARGDLGEALRILSERVLPVFEQLGEVPQAATVWGTIGQIAYQRGELEEAASWQGKVLEASRELGDIGEIAVADLVLAKIDLDRGDHESALPRIAESLEHFRLLERSDGIAIVAALGESLMAGGNAREAREVLAGCRAAAAEMGMTDLVHEIDQLLGEAAGPVS